MADFITYKLLFNMKVLFVPPMSYPLHAGGFESQVLHIFNELRNLGLDVSWYELSKTDISQYDIIHFHSSVTEFVSIAIKARDLGKKLIITTMVGSPRYSNNSYRFKLCVSRLPGMFYFIKKIRDLYSMMDHFITLTSYEKKRLELTFKVQNDVTVIPNGIDDCYLNINSDPDSIELPFNNYILVVGRVEPDKNQLPLIEIVNDLGINLIIVGESGAGHINYFNRCKEVSGRNVYFWGRESNPNKLRLLYKNATLTAIPSLTEMLPLVIYESLSQGTPVLCTTKCGLYPEMVDGLFYTKPTKADLRRNIVKYWTNLCACNIGIHGIYSWKDIAHQHITIYNNLMSKTHSNNYAY